MHRSRSSFIRYASAFLAVLAAAVAAPPPQAAEAAGPTVNFGGRRFSASRGFEAFESIAFDPVNKRIASRGSILTQCGARVSDGPDESPGLAWDYATNRYWQITNNRTVRIWNGAALEDTAFVIPETFNVPGSGPDTLESVRGIAVDANFVYVVDSGPNGTSGQIASNAWFKFTRTGTPVKSSKSTTLLSNLQMNPDCLFDDILYLPAGSPVYPGRFLIPLEHSGLIVVDDQGEYAGSFYWDSDPANLNLIKPFAFTGMALDPAAGTFYLAENDGASSQVWTMLAEAAPTSYIVGAGGGQAYMQWPLSHGCNLPLWRDFPPPNQTDPWLIFGLAYRPADEKVYGYDFNSGALWKFNPLQGEAALVDATGPQSVWGIAFDTQRNVLYASQETGGFSNQIHSVDPANGNTTMLPSLVGFYLNDIAFNPNDNGIYGVSSDARLIRINRDTGAGTVVGNTQSGIRGLDYDPATNRLIGFANSPGRLYSINPATGGAALLSNMPNDVGWEGLAVITLPASTTDAAGASPRPSGLPRIFAAPNPTSGLVQLRVNADAAVAGDISAFDASGRLVRRIYDGTISAGTQIWTWDGRDGSGRRVPAGVYWIRLRAGSTEESAKVVWMP